LYELGRDYEKNWQAYLKQRKTAGFGVYPVPDAPADAEPDAAQDKPKNIRLLYFVTLAKKFGKESEQCQVPDSVNTVSDLLAYLRKRGGVWNSALKEGQLNITVNKQFGKPDTKIADDDEIAIVPSNPVR
jgi:molybdopterin synthase sulfur carrier subunit